MARYEYRDLKPTAEAEDLYRRWLCHLDEEFTRHKESACGEKSSAMRCTRFTSAVPTAASSTPSLISELPGNVLQLSLDPANVTLEPEYYGDVDKEKYCERKPLIFFWQMFDKSALGLNHWLGFRFRKMLAKHIFKHVGKNVEDLPGS